MWYIQTVFQCSVLKKTDELLNNEMSYFHEKLVFLKHTIIDSKYITFQKHKTMETVKILMPDRFL